MNIRKLLLSSAGALVLTTGMALAQSNDPYTHNPTPEERAQTQQLNDQAQGQASTDNDASDMGQQQYQQQQQQYQDQQQRYQHDQQAYSAQQQNYWDERADYNFDRTHPGAWWHDRYQQASLNHFYDIPRSELIDLRVATDDGFRVGRISELDRHDDGRVSSVRIEFRDGESAWVHARDLRYDPADRIVFTDLSLHELRQIARNS
jgi:multidrug efflux pump subunit AcrA (membrane-fusion protein)